MNLKPNLFRTQLENSISNAYKNVFVFLFLLLLNCEYNSLRHSHGVKFVVLFFLVFFLRISVNNETTLALFPGRCSWTHPLDADGKP